MWCFEKWNILYFFFIPHCSPFPLVYVITKLGNSVYCQQQIAYICLSRKLYPPSFSDFFFYYIFLLLTLPYIGSSVTVMDGFCVKFDSILILQVITSIFMRVILSGINKNYVSMQNCPIFSYQIIMTWSSSGANKCDFNAFKTLYIFFLCWYWNNSPPTLPPIPKKIRFSN